MEGASGGDDHEDPSSDQPASKKRYHRHTVQQTRQLEMFFKECPHPDEKQRQDLSRELGLEPRQVKFWFQNRRTQMKAHHERADNSMLRAENESLRAENMALHDALKNASCPKCGGALTPGELSFGEHHLRLENARLKDELNRITAMLSKYIARSSGAANILPDFPFDISAGLEYHPPEPPAPAPELAPSLLELASRPGGLTDSEKQLVAELAIIAMDELLQVAGAQPSSDAGSLWIAGGKPGVTPGTREKLNLEEYSRQFTRGLGPSPLGLSSEATKETGVVMMSAVALVDSVMNTGRWLDIFSSIVARGFTTEVLTTGVGSNWNNALQLLYAELQILSPLVPTRELYFLRYCKQHSDNVWAVVDVSIDGLRENAPPTQFRCRLRPSGFLIEDLQNGCSKVTVLQHFESPEVSSSRQMNIHGIFHQLVSSGAAFGALRWLATLQRQSERLAVLVSTNLSTRDLGAISSVSGRRSLLLLAQRMTSSYCAGVSSSIIHSWTTLSGPGTGEETGRVMTRKSITNAGVVLSAATSLWIPESSQRLFEFLRDERLRSEWDILSNGGSVQEIARAPTGQDVGCVVSLFRVDALNSSQSNMLILQESCTDSSGSLIVYAPVDISAMNLVMQGGDPGSVGLLPSGFAIVSDGAAPRTTSTDTNIGSSSSSSASTGSLLTVAFQILVSSVPTAKLNLESVTTVNSLITSTIQRIKTALGC